MTSNSLLTRQKQWPHGALLWACVLAICLTGHSIADPPEPTLPSPQDLRSRREEIYAELDDNVEAVKQCFEILDATPEEDEETRQLVDQQIQRFDDRTSVLHDELAEIDRFQALAKHQRELVDEVARLRSEAEQLLKHGHHAPAQLRFAKAKSIQRTLDDGTWKILVNDRLVQETDQPGLVSVLQLDIEIQNLKQEAAQLRDEVKSLKESVRRLEAWLTKGKAKVQP